MGAAAVTLRRLAAPGGAQAVGAVASGVGEGRGRASHTAARAADSRRFGTTAKATLQLSKSNFADGWFWNIDLAVHAFAQLLFGTHAKPLIVNCVKE